MREGKRGRAKEGRAEREIKWNYHIVEGRMPPLHFMHVAG